MAVIFSKIMKKDLFQKNNLQKGFVILFTILISAIILMIGLGIFSIATRETVLSGTAREAQYAFYAADAGVECALYAESIPQGPLSVLGYGSQFACGNNTTITISGHGSELEPYMFNVTMGTGQAMTCAKVSIFDTSTNSGHPARRVIAQGYNVCNPDGTPNTKNPILVERDLDTLYETGTLVPISNTPTTPPSQLLQLPASAAGQKTGTTGNGANSSSVLQTIGGTQIPVNAQKTVNPNSSLLSN
jgi:uncharacterized protein (UPF0333 family)